MTSWRGLAEGEAVRGWAMSEPEERPFPGVARPMPDTVDYRFFNGWVATGDLPCREALRASLPDRQVACPEGPFADLVLAGEGPEMDFSRFCHQPTLIVRGFRCLLRGAPGAVARFRVATCGGVRLWLDGQAVGMFEPFTRNTPDVGIIAFPLQGGVQELTLRLEDLHERDTTCFFALTRTGGDSVETALPEGFDPQAVDEAGAVMAGLRMDRLFYRPGQRMRLVADRPPQRDLPIRIQGPLPFGRGGLTLDPAAQTSAVASLGPGRDTVDLGPADRKAPGCLSVVVEMRVGGARLRRQLGTTVLQEGQSLAGDLETRKAAMRRLIAETGGFEPSVALCQAAEGMAKARMGAIIEAALTTIEARDDCSDFSILPLLRLYRDHRDTLPGPLAARMRAAFLGYRYWLDEPGADVMWFWSENHVLCFHTAQLVAGQLFPNEIFGNSGHGGVEQVRRATARLDRWFAAIDEDGLCEWNSAAYYPIDLLGLLTLHDMAPEFRARARAVIDRVLVMAALHTVGGVPAGSQGRCYEKELLAGRHTELGSVMALLSGQGVFTGYDRATGLLCLSDYAPPARLEDLQSPPAGQSLRAAYTQGHGGAGRLSLWKSAEAQLSTVRVADPGGHGHQAQVLDVQLARHPLARLWINHPGEARDWGERRPSLLAGSHVMPAVVQDGPLAMMVYDLRRDWTDLHFTQLFAAADAVGAPERLGGWLVFADQVGVWCSVHLQVVEAGTFAGSLWRAHDMRTGWCVTLRLTDEPADAFARRLAEVAPEFEAEALTLSARNASGERLSLDGTGRATRDGQPWPFSPMSSVPHLGWNDGPLTEWKGRE